MSLRVFLLRNKCTISSVLLVMLGVSLGIIAKVFGHVLSCYFWVVSGFVGPHRDDVIERRGQHEQSFPECSLFHPVAVAIVLGAPRRESSVFPVLLSGFRAGRDGEL